MIILEETDDRFYLAESKLPGAGTGCFARVRIAKGDFLEIIGVLVPYDSAADRCTHYANRYKFAAEPEKEFRHVLVPMGYGGMVNQANDRDSQNVSLTHLPDKVRCGFCNGRGCDGCKDGWCKRYFRSEFACRAVYVALRDIEPGEELLGNYNKKLGRLVVDGTAWSADDQAEWLKFIKRDLYGLGVLLDSKWTK